VLPWLRSRAREAWSAAILWALKPVNAFLGSHHCPPAAALIIIDANAVTQKGCSTDGCTA
jgi:hypothetical protein